MTKTHQLKWIMRNSLSETSFWPGPGQYPRYSPRGVKMFLLFLRRSFLPQRTLL